ncbi:MAG TPA: F0F1 ATP synthase subunit B [Gemmatimonadales bacterium]|nr:F0F1 ATP synthase subunit B [Gemmatimonadales bacterium]
MRTSFMALLALAGTATSAAAQESEKVDLLAPSGGLMLWTLLIFVVLLIVLSRFAFPPLLAAVEAREKALQDAIDEARGDREAAAALLAEHQAAIASARTEAQQIIAQGRATSEELKQKMIAETRHQQDELLERARQEIELEKQRAIVQLRREAVEMAIAGAGKVVRRNFDSEANRQIVDEFLSTVSLQSTHKS